MPDTKVDSPATEPKVEASESETKPTESQQTFDADYVKKLRAESAKYRTEAKDLAAKAKKFDELEEANKSDLEKAQTAAKEAQAALEAANLKAMRAQVGASQKLPPSMISRLQGSTEEEMIADAQAMLEDIKSEYVAKAAPSKKDTGAGVAGEASDLESKSPAELAAMINKR